MAGTVGRGALREEAILRATLDLLAESGYDQLTIDAVAARARCSKATIYRRWQGKTVLVTTAVRRYAGQPGTAASDAGSLRLDLLASLQAMRSSLLGQDAALILGLLVAMRRDPELASAVRDQVLAAKREAFGTAIAQAIARGDIPATTDTALLAEICSAVLLSRLLVTGEPLDDAFVEHLVDGVLLPVLRQPPKLTTGELPECGRRSFSVSGGGVLAANGFPHFSRGITKRSYPCGLGNGPVPNFIAGWTAFVVAGLPSDAGR